MGWHGQRHHVFECNIRVEAARLGQQSSTPQLEATAAAAAAAAEVEVHIGSDEAKHSMLHEHGVDDLFVSARGGLGEDGDASVESPILGAVDDPTPNTLAVPLQPLPTPLGQNTNSDTNGTKGPPKSHVDLMNLF